MIRYFQHIVWVMLGLIVFTVAMRLLPHPPGVTPVGAAGLFAGAYLAHRSVWLVPMLALLVSDLIIGFYVPLIMVFVYAGTVLSVLIGRVFLSTKRSIWRFAGAIFFSALIFFILSNLGLWISGKYYPLTMAGFSACYINAIPYFGRSLLGDAMYVVILFGGYHLLKISIDKWQLCHGNTSTY